MRAACFTDMTHFSPAFVPLPALRFLTGSSPRTTFVNSAMQLSKRQLPPLQPQPHQKPCAQQAPYPHQANEHMPIKSDRQSATDDLDSKVPLSDAAFSDPLIRPRGDLDFAIPFNDNFVIRHWQPRDLNAVQQIISECLAEYDCSWDPEGTDIDAVKVPECFRMGELWVVEDVSTSTVVGCGGFYPFPSVPGAIEIRKLFLRPDVRGQGIGSFLLCALEHRASQLGFRTAVVETLNRMEAANVIYRHTGYKPSCHALVVDRCDSIMEKDISTLSVGAHNNIDNGNGNGNDHDRDHGHDKSNVHLEVTDSSKGWRIASLPRFKIERHRLIFRAAVVLVQQRNTDAKVVVHKRSVQKKTYPGRMATLVTGCADWGEDPIETARREVFEEVGITGLEFVQSFTPFYSGDAGRQRILFHPFVATGDFDEKDLVCDPSEVEFAKLMTREEIQTAGIGGRLWAEFRTHGL